MDIIATWKNHPLNVQGVVELVPTEWLWRIRGKDVCATTDLSDGRTVTMGELWQNILEGGLRDPLIIRAGVKNRMFRLEAGNHRIQVLHAHGVPLIPVTVQLRDECGPHVADVMNDGSHNFEAGEDLLVDSIPSEYLKPSDVFKSLRHAC